ncbi:MAG TPA: hypothetical protein VJM51_01210, partial [Dehalococcoidia bacterium]|nr:hypothetical protein [Dehalococcoidia bacterium]
MSGFIEGLVRPKIAVTGGLLLAAAALAIVLWLTLAGGPRPAFATEGECAHADTLVAYSSGVVNPANALGPQDGNYVVMGDGGSVTVAFTAQAIYDGPGADFRVYEAQVPPVEHALVEVSADGVSFV